MQNSNSGGRSIDAAAQTSAAGAASSASAKVGDARDVTGTGAAAAGQDDRVLAAISYVLWPVALLLLFLSGRSRFLRYHIAQALAVNVLGMLLYIAASFTSRLPLIGWQSAFFIPYLMPGWFLFDVYLAIRAYGGYMTRVPIAADYAAKHSG